MTDRAIALGGLKPAPDPPPRPAPARVRRTPSRRVHVSSTVVHAFSGTAASHAIERREPDAARIEELRSLCAPATGNNGGPFPSYGTLPHGRPLFLDGSTQCASCCRSAWWDDLNAQGCCVTCGW